MHIFIQKMEESGSNDKEIRVVCNGVVKKLLVPASALIASNANTDLQPNTEDVLGVSEDSNILQDYPPTTIQPQVITPDGSESLPNLSGEDFSTPAVVPSTLYQANSVGSTPVQLNFSASLANPLSARPPLYGNSTTGVVSENFRSTSFPQVHPISITPNVASPPNNPHATVVSPPRESDGVHLTDLSQLNELLAKSAARNASIVAANSQALLAHQNAPFTPQNMAFHRQNTTPIPTGAPIANPNFLSIAPKAPPIVRYRSTMSPAPSNPFMGHQQPSTSLLRPSNVIVVRGKNPPKRHYPEPAPQEPETTLISMRDAEGVVRQLPVQVMTDSQGIKRRVVGYSESGGQRSAVVHTEDGLILCPMNDQTASKEQTTNHIAPPQAQPPDHRSSLSKQAEASSVQEITQDMDSSDTDSASETLSPALPAVHYSKAEYENLIKQARKYPTRVVLRNLKMRSRKLRVPMSKLATRFWMHLKCDWLGTPGLLRPFRFTSATGSKVKVSSMQVHTSCDLNEWYRVIPSDQIGLCKDPKTVTSPQTIRSPNHVRVLPLVTDSTSPKPVAATPKQKTPKAKPRNPAIPLKPTAKTKPEVKKKPNASKPALSPDKTSSDYLDKLIDSVAKSGGSSRKPSEKKPKTSEKQVRQILSSYNMKPALELHAKSNLRTAHVNVEVLGSTLQRSLVIGQSLADTMQALCLDEDSETEMRTKKMAEKCRKEAERSLKKSKKKKERSAGLLSSAETPKTSATKRNKTPKSRANKVTVLKNITPPPTLTRRASAEIMSPETEFSPPVLHRYCDGADCTKCRGNNVIADDDTAAVMTAMRRRSSSGRVLRARSKRGSQSNLFEVLQHN